MSGELEVLLYLPSRLFLVLQLGVQKVLGHYSWGVECREGRWFFEPCGERNRGGGR